MAATGAESGGGPLLSGHEPGAIGPHEESLGALSIVKEMEKEWLATLALDPHCDYAGADRNLGLLYRDAPGFPLSIGSRGKAEQCLQHAVQLNS
jgi:hypothetical protein